MENIAVVTLKESEYKAIYHYLKSNRIEPISVSILPDDSELRANNDIYATLMRDIAKLNNKAREIRFNTLTNK